MKSLLFFFLFKCSPHRVDELSLLAREIPTCRTPRIEERSLDALFLSSLSHVKRKTAIGKMRYFPFDPQSPSLKFKWVAHVARRVLNLSGSIFTPKKFISSQFKFNLFCNFDIFVKIPFLGSTIHPMPRKSLKSYYLRIQRNSSG